MRSRTPTPSHLVIGPDRGALAHVRSQLHRESPGEGQTPGRDRQACTVAEIVRHDIPDCYIISRARKSPKPVGYIHKCKLYYVGAMCDAVKAATGSQGKGLWREARVTGHARG